VRQRLKMSISITQLILVIIVGILLFGNLPKLFKDVGTGIVSFKKIVNSPSVSKEDSPDQAKLETSQTPITKKTESEVKEAVKVTKPEAFTPKKEERDSP